MTRPIPKTIPSAPLTTPDVWLGRDIAADRDWRYDFTPQDIADLLNAARAARSRNPDRRTWTAADVPLPGLASLISVWSADLDQGRGFVLLRGFPVDRHDETVCSDVYWALGLHLGRAVPQNTDGDVLGHVRDTGEDPRAYGVRLYRTRAEQDFHTDGADIIGLFCLAPARSGGISRIASSPMIYNRLRVERRDLAPVLFTPFPFDRQGQQKPGEAPWFEVPLCRYEGGRLRTFFIPWYIRESQQHAAAPRLTPDQTAAVAFIEAAANDPDAWLDMNFRPGDMQFLNNGSVLHKRTEYEDWDDPARKRHLLRLWLSTARG